MDTEEIIKALSSVQFKQSLDWTTYIVIAFFSGIGGWFASYFKEKGKNYANKEDFNELKRQLTLNTEVVEGIKVELFLAKSLFQHFPPQANTACFFLGLDPVPYL